VLTDLNALADHQISTLLREQPHGPYRLAGFSIGGIVAFEMARRLQARGEVVEFLGAIEAGVPRPRTPDTTRREKYGRLIRRRDLTGIMREISEALQGRSDDVKREMTKLRTHAGAHQRVLDGMVEAFIDFEPSPLDTSVTLFFGDEASDESLKPLINMWRELATDGVEVRRVTGAHDDDTILREPHAGALAMALEDELKTCDRKARS
jgi:thioesterase domain-containing protein